MTIAASAGSTGALRRTTFGAAMPAPGAAPAQHGRAQLGMSSSSVDSDDHAVVGKIGRVTGTVAPGRTGEVTISVRGGTEAFLAYAAEDGQTIPEHARVVVVEYHAPRTVYVTPA